MKPTRSIFSACFIVESLFLLGCRTPATAYEQGVEEGERRLRNRSFAFRARMCLEWHDLWRLARERGLIDSSHFPTGDGWLMMFASLLQEVDAESEEDRGARGDAEAVDAVVPELRKRAGQLVLDGDAEPSAWRTVPSSMEESLWEIRDWETAPISLSVEKSSLEDTCQDVVQQIDRWRAPERNRFLIGIVTEDPDSGWTFQSPRLTITCTNANAGEIVSLLGEMTDMRIVRSPNHVLFKPKGMGDGLRSNVVWTILSPTPCDEDAPDNSPPFYLFGAGAQAQPPSPNPEAAP